DQSAANQEPGRSVLIDPKNIAWPFRNREKEFEEVKEGENEENDDDDKRCELIARITTSNILSTLVKSSNGSPAQWDIGCKDQWNQNRSTVAMLSQS
uniref:Uncharacterized protein n=1 Tax=Romanomermis culicivorax TaxID=13658 RepID=A0A915KDM1_ROMCU